MSRSPQPDTTPVDSGAGFPVHLPELPPRDPFAPTGTGNQLAEQAAERDVASGAYDPVQVAAGDVSLPWQKERLARVELDRSQTELGRIQQLFVALGLLQRARDGQLVPSTVGVESTTLIGAEAELKRIDAELAKVTALHETAEAVLTGEQPDSDGTPRPGRRIAPGSKDPRGAAKRERLQGWALLVVPFLVEGAIVASNMYAFNRGSVIEAITLAFAALAVLTVGPYMVGQQLAGVFARGRARIGDIVILAVAVPFWVGTALSLAVTRVRLDQNHTIERLEESQANAVTRALDAGTTVPLFDPIVPDQVFDPIVPTIMWVSILLGIGAVLAVVEAAHYNPVRFVEIDLRASRQDLQRTRQLILERTGILTGSVELQEEAIETTEAYYDEALESSKARGEVDLGVYSARLISASGDPEMLGAIETRQAATALRGSVSESLFQAPRSPAAPVPAPTMPAAPAPFSADSEAAR